MKKITLFLLTLIFNLSLNAQYIVDFEGDGEVKTAYAAGTVNLSGLDWELTQVLIGTADADWKNGNRSARLRGYGDSEMVMVQDKANGAGSITFEYKRYGSDDQVDWRVEYSTDAGNTWIQVGDSFTAPDSDVVQTFSEQVDEEGDIRFRIKRETEDGTQNRRLNIDDIVITDFGASDIVLNVASPSEGTVLPPDTNSTMVNLTTIGFEISTDDTSGDGDGYVQYSLNQGNFVDVFSNSFELTDLNIGESYLLIVKLVDNNGDDLEPSVQVERTFSVADFIQVANISELRADFEENGAGRFYEITGQSTMSHADDFNNRKWFQDNNFSGILVFDSEGVIAEDAYQVGDQVTNLTGVTSLFGGLLQFEPLEDNGNVVGNNIPQTQIISLSEFVNNFEQYESTLVGFEDVFFVEADGMEVFATNQNYEFSDGENTSIVRTIFFGADYIDNTIPSGSLEGLRGVAGQFNGTHQIHPRNNNDIDVTLNVNSFENVEFNLYPNPAKNYVNLEVPAGEVYEVNVYSVTGKKVLTQRINGSTRLDLSSLNSGVYMVNFKQGSLNTTRKLIIN